jgi:hypothetical protein
MPRMRVIVTGSRDWMWVDPIYQALSSAYRSGNGGSPLPFTVVHGGAAGADTIAGEWARIAPDAIGLVNVTEEVHKADWNQYALRAGYIRNKEMVDAGADLVLAFVNPCNSPKCPRRGNHSSHGAKNCMKLAQVAGIRVIAQYGNPQWSI